eukprot:scaffold86615_cov20-Tisochrysis_lutea.AAC.3
MKDKSKVLSSELDILHNEMPSPLKAAVLNFNVQLNLESVEAGDVTVSSSFLSSTVCKQEPAKGNQDY